MILRDLDNDSRSHAFIPVEPAPPGDEQREIILRAMAGRFPDARWKTYNEEKQIASFIVPNKLFKLDYGERLRALFARQELVEEVLDFGASQLFAGATNYTCILVLYRLPEPMRRLVDVEYE